MIIKVDTPLKIAMLTSGFPRWEGDLFGPFVAEQARALVRAGHLVRLVAPAGKGLSGAAQEEGVEVFRARYAWPPGLQKLAYGGGLMPNLRAKPYLALLIPGFLASLGWAASARALEADVFHGQWVVSGFIGRLTRPLHGRPVVVTLRGTDLALLRGVPKWLARLLLQGFDRVTTVSSEIAEAVVGFGVPEDKVALTPNGVNVAIFQPREKTACRAELGLTDFRDQGPLLLWAGRLAPEKGLDVLLRALARLIKIEPRVRLVLLGEGHSRTELEKLTRELGLSGAVDFKGAVTQKELAVWYGAADLVCLSSHREGRPNTVLEAMASARPVLSTRVGGVPELVEEGVQGRLVPPGDPEALARAAAQMLAHPAQTAALGTAGPTRLQTLGLTWEANARRMVDIYRQVLAENDPERRPEFKGGRLIALFTAVWLIGVGGLWLRRFLTHLDQSYSLVSRLGDQGPLSLIGQVVKILTDPWWLW